MTTRTTQTQRPSFVARFLAGAAEAWADMEYANRRMYELRTDFYHTARR